MNLGGNLFAVKRNGIAHQNGDMNLLSIGEHEVEGLEFRDLLSGVHVRMAEDNEGVEGEEVAFDFVVVLGVDGLVGQEFEFVAVALGGDVGADVVCFEGGHGGGTL